jgi:hypothetical protein
MRLQVHPAKDWLNAVIAEEDLLAGVDEARDEVRCAHVAWPHHFWVCPTTFKYVNTIHI